MNLRRTVERVLLLAPLPFVCAACVNPQLYNDNDQRSSWDDAPPTEFISDRDNRLDSNRVPPAQGNLPPAIVDNTNGAPADRDTYVVVSEDRVNAETGRVYRVRKGDSLAIIARRFYGDTEAWKKIYAANRDIINNPNALEPGIDLRLP